MVSQVTLNCNKDARIADNGTSLGAGASDCNPIGLYGSYLYRTLLGFPVSFAGMTSIVSAYLKVKTSNQLYVGFGSDPDFRVQRLTSSWSEGSSVSMSTTNAVEWTGQPGVDADYALCTPSEAENTWGTYNVSALIQEAFAAGVFYGFRLSGFSETNAADCTEIWSRESGNGTPQLIINYETNVGPNPPVNLGCTPSLTPTFVFDHSDNDGDAPLNYDIQVSSDSSFATVDGWNGAAVTTGIAGNHVSVVGPALTRGVTYYWRVATRSATGIGTTSGWTSGASFRLNQLPTVTLQSPASSGAAVEMSYVVGSGAPKAVIRWAFSDPDGGAQAGWQVVVMAEGGAVIRDTTYQSGAASSYTVPDNLTRGTNYRVTVTVWDSAGETAVANYVQFKPQWAVAEYRTVDLGTVTAWSAVPDSTSPGNTLVVTEYSSSDSAVAGPWVGSLSSSPLGHYFHWRVWLFAWAGAASPTFKSMALTFTSSLGVPPDGWSGNAAFALDTGTKVYGTQSMRGTCDGAGYQWIQQVIKVQKKTDYVLSGRIQSDGDTYAYYDVTSKDGTLILGSTPQSRAAHGWTRVQTGVFNSKEAEELIVRCIIGPGPAGTKAWFDAVKLENSKVVTAWTPGFVGSGVSLDVGGIKVDASPKGGATFRLQGSAGGGRDTVELGGNGLKFGGDAEFYSPAAGVLETPGGLNVGGGLGVGGALTLAVDRWHVSSDGKTRAYYMNNGRTFYGAMNGHEWRGASDQWLADVSEAGVLNVGSVTEGGVRLIQPAGLRIQRGTVTVVGNGTPASTSVAVAFSPVFSGVPVVVLTSAWVYLCPALSVAPTASGFSAQVADTRATNITNGANHVLNWIAIGPA